MIRLQGPRLAVALLIVILAGGTVGYAAIEGWGAWDALFMTVTTVTTVGYREIHPLSFAGQVFTVALILGGVGTAFYTATLVATAVVEGGLHRTVEQRRLSRMLEHLTDHFILCGFGRIGGIVARELHQQKVPFIVIERDPERLHTVLENGWLGLAADASREDVLERAGIRRARGLLAAVGTDAENVYTVLTARGLRQDLFIIARVEADDAEPKLMRAGADRVVSPYHIGATTIVQTALRPAVVDFVRLATSSEYLDLSMEQVKVGTASAYVGKSLLETGVTSKFGVIIVGIKHTGGGMQFNPSPEDVLRSGDELVVLGRPESIKALEQEAA